MTCARKILIVCGAPYVSGKEIASLTLAKGLRDAGHDVAFVSSSWTNGDFVGRLQAEGFAYYSLRVGFISKTLKLSPVLMTLDQLRYWPMLIWGYVGLIRRRKPDVVVHTNWHHAVLLLPCLDWSRDVFWLHEMVPPGRFYARMFCAIAARTACMVCVSKAVADSLLRIGVPEHRVVIVHNGISAVDPIPAPGNESELRLGIVGQIASWKGHDLLLDAVAILARAGQAVTLHIFGIGDPRYADLLKQKIERLNLAGYVQWAGFVRSQRDIYAAIDVCAMPSRYDEPLGMSAIEAGGYGRPVVCFARGGLVEIVQDGKSGIVVSSETPGALAEAIAKLANDRELLRAMGRAAQARMTDVFSLTNFVRGFEAAIDRSAA